MDLSAFVHATLLVGSSFATAAAVLATAHLFRRWQQESSALGSSEDAIFLFDDRRLVDATPAGRQMIAAAPKGRDDWGRFTALVSDAFPNLGDRISTLSVERALSLSAPDGSTLAAEWIDGMARIKVALARPDATSAGLGAEGSGTMAGAEPILDSAPILAWREDADGTVIWANRAYRRQADLDSAGQTKVFRRPAEAKPDRQVVRFDGGQSAWFDVHLSEDANGPLLFAVPVDALVAAEEKLKSFHQTLGKTFAHLTTGLAVFDRTRRLTLFNPALADLTRLPLEFLAARPSLFAFFDRLRDAQMMPEPKDYKGWRNQLAALEAAAIDGTYGETWTLPNGLTYRVTGRPHPDGALAFLLDDISAEMSLNRRFRAELDLGRAVFDNLPSAIAVITGEGVLAMTNRAYDELWQAGEDDTDILTVSDALRSWNTQCSPSPHWSDLRQRLLDRADRSEWQGEIRMLDGRGLLCRMAPLPAGAALISFETVRPRRLRATASGARASEDHQTIRQAAS